MARTLICPKCSKAAMDPEHVWEDSLRIKCDKCGEWSDTDRWKTVRQLQSELYRLPAALSEEVERLKDAAIFSKESAAKSFNKAEQMEAWEQKYNAANLRAERLERALERIRDAAGSPSHCLHCEQVWEVVNQYDKEALAAEKGGK